MIRVDMGDMQVPAKFSPRFDPEFYAFVEQTVGGDEVNGAVITRWFEVIPGLEVAIEKIRFP